MPLRVYNTLVREKEEFKPISGKKVGMYVCGVTPYDVCHLGHARAYVSFDMVRRYLEFKGYGVKHVQNFTDVDDKIINKARKEGGPQKATAIAARFIEQYFADMDALGVRRAHLYPKVSEHMVEIVALVKRLVEKGTAYEVDGDVFYDVSKFGGYGKLSKQPLEQMRAGARIDVDARKRSPMDFALWKKAKPDEPSWESPWGLGRPGWHIECSAMSTKYLGESFDIHGGGMDLIFPHHENEIAQSEGATGRQFVKYWLHNGFITIDQEKMSKSLGNFFTIKDVMMKYSPEAIRFFLLSTHYRAPIDFSDALLVNAQNNLSKLHNCMDNLGAGLRNAEEGTPNEAENALLGSMKEDREKFLSAMDDDFNTPLAISAVFEIVKKANTYMMERGQRKAVLKAMLDELVELGSILNFYKTGAVAAGGGPSDAEIDGMVAERQDARKRKDFKLSDELRDELKEIGIVIEDQKDGSVRWKRAR